MSKIGVKFGDVHSYDTWGLRLKAIHIGTPEVKTAYVDIPGRMGPLDLTEAQYGGIRYGTRELELTFDAKDCSYLQWPGLLSRVASALHGHKCKIILDIDAGYYYYGRCVVDSTKSNETSAEVVVTCTCDPYKLSVSSSDEPWIWDTFNFRTGVITSTNDIKISAADDWKLVKLSGYPYNETLKIVSNNDVQMRFGNDTYNLVSGENIMHDVELVEGENDLYFKGTATITIVHRGGVL